MAEPASTSLWGRLTDADNKFQAWRSGFAASAKAIRHQPSPRVIGSAIRGDALLTGKIRAAGDTVSAPNRLPWDVPHPTPRFTDHLHGFSWLDDLGARGGREARVTAQKWVWSWIEKYGAARGPGWVPDLTGTRLCHWLSHAPFLLKEIGPGRQQQFFRSLGRQTAYLSNSWDDAPQGLPRFEALTGLLIAGVSIEGAEPLVDRAGSLLGKECFARIGADGGMASRNPEELATVFSLLVWSARTLEEAGGKPHPDHIAALARMAPAIRLLRLGDGGIAQFHGGSRGLHGLVEQALADGQVRLGQTANAAMGFSRMSGGRTILVIDTGGVPEGDGALTAHAAPLAFEMSTGRRPFLLNCGTGTEFGDSWSRASRNIAAHTAMVVSGTSPAKFGALTRAGRIQAEPVKTGPKTVTVERATDRSGQWLLCGHDGYAPINGLVHERRLFLATDGGDLRGEDTLSATGSKAENAFTAAMRKHGRGVPIATHFHLHPDVAVEADSTGQALVLTLPSGEQWGFRQSGGTTSVEPSVCLDPHADAPRATKQIVVKTVATSYATRMNWVFKREGTSAQVLRDIVEDPIALPDQEL
ncbi:MAG: heparinase II/III family protein [Pseudomonadota bacterium]